MKILAINGSHRGRKGYTQFLIDKVFEGAVQAGAQCATVVLAEQDVQRCTGCFTCQLESRLFKCIYDGKDDAKAIFDKIRDADLIIFATPVYVFNISSLLKNLFDRYPATSNCNSVRVSKSGLFFHHIDQQLCSKPFATLICQDNMEYETHRNILSYFKTYARFMDAKYVGSLVRRSGMAAGHGWDETKLEKYPQLVGIYNAYAQAGRELAETGKISKGTERMANRQILHVPFFARFLPKNEKIQTILNQKSRNFI